MLRSLQAVSTFGLVGLLVGCSAEGESAAAEGETVGVRGHASARIACTEAALRTALTQVASAGGGTVTFDCIDAIIEVADQIVFRGNNLILDGEDRKITFRYSGTDPCDQTEGLDRFLEIYGNRNVIRNLTIDRFPEGIHFQSGDGNVGENLRFPIVCEDAITNGGSGHVATNTVVRNSYFENSEDKAVMISNGGSITIEGSEFVDCMQPVRAGAASGRVVVRNNTFRGRSSGPRFNGGSEGMFITFEGNTVSDATYGIRVYDDAQAVVRNNRFQLGKQTGEANAVYAAGRARVRVEGNTITGYTSSPGVLVKDSARADLGGGSVAIDGKSAVGAGGNTLRNGKKGAPHDLTNQTKTEVHAEKNLWDQATAAEVRQHDVSGPADVDPIGR